MKVRALRTVYNRPEGREYQKDQEFDTTEREARSMVKLKKAVIVEHPARDDSRKYSAKVQVAEQTVDSSSDIESPRRYRRRDMTSEG